METLVDGKILSTEEINLIRQYRAKQDFNTGFATGLSAAAKSLESLANECGGGSGTGSTADTYRLAAKHILRVKIP